MISKYRNRGIAQLACAFAMAALLIVLMCKLKRPINEDWYVPLLFL